MCVCVCECVCECVCVYAYLCVWLTCTVVSEEAENMYTPCADSVTLSTVTIPMCPLRVQR